RKIVRQLQQGGASPLVERLLAEWDDCAAEAEAIQATVVTNPPLAVGEEPTITAGVDGELDRLRELRDGGKDGIARIQTAERDRTGIASLKVGFNKVFGYYI